MSHIGGFRAFRAHAGLTASRPERSSLAVDYRRAIVVFTARHDVLAMYQVARNATISRRAKPLALGVHRQAVFLDPIALNSSA